MLVPGLLQTADYARALFRAWQTASNDDELEDLVSARPERQAILDPPKPPELWVALDEAVLHRAIGHARSLMTSYCTSPMRRAVTASRSRSCQPRSVLMSACWGPLSSLVSTMVRRVSCMQSEPLRVRRSSDPRRSRRRR